MASLTPGTLSSLLSPTPSKPTSHHRSSLLQIIAIVPSFNNTDTIFPNKGFFIRVSDSLHSAYVSVSEKDAELILGDKIQLGQFVYVEGLDGGAPVPVVRGLKVVPKRRECVGSPVDLIGSEVLVGKKEKKGGRRVSLGGGKSDGGVEMRRLSLDSSRKGWDRNLLGKYGGAGRPGSSHSSASILASKTASYEKNSTLMQRSFSPLKQALSHRKSFSEKDLIGKAPSPRISPLKQVIPHRKSVSERDLTVKPPSPRISPLKQVLPNRKSLSDKNTFRPPSPRNSPRQHGLTNKNGASERDSASKHSSSNLSQSKHVPPSTNQLSEKKSTHKPLNIGVSPLQNKNVNDSPSPVSKPIRKDIKQSTDGTNLGHLFKVPLSLKTLSDAKILWGSLPSTIHDLGKEVVSRRNSQFVAAVYALQETSATENVLQCMRMFAELCESSEKESSLPLVEEFLDLHQNMHRVATVINGLRFPEESSLQCALPEAYKNFADQNALHWVQAAVQSNLSKFNLYTKEDKRGDINAEKCHFVILENTTTKVDVENHSPDKKQSPRNQRAVVSGSSSKTSSPYNSKPRLSTTRKATNESEVWSKGNGLQVAASLAEKLISASQAWFLDYLDASLQKEFGLQKGEMDAEIACLLGQLKRVNQWLEDSLTNGSGTNERIEGLKKKIYGFLLNNVDAAVVQTGS
ncbi:uncharacterized protein LOC108203186 [Daucus carota subsp. sativus]|uniref:Uncharacterized protein n=1 Tax=Daucus carota subsp. sativus TaxID=79200 RepID=A0A175YFD3_DAUCS|nr:PREDICTED: uncharacterized protein LOC108203186 [Daucus carota subsp. sativus]